MQSQWDFLQYAASLRLPTNPLSRRCENLDEVIAFCQQMAQQRLSLDYEVDGVVVKVNDFVLQERLGYTQKSPRWAVAYKFPAYQATTQVKAITVQVGRTGVLTPVAELEPVACAGVTISRATLHNFDEIKRLGVNIGDRVVLERAGDVIPKIIHVIEKGNQGHFPIPTQCPCCAGMIHRDTEGVALRCSNPACPKQIERALVHFASRSAMDIEGLGEAVVRQILEKGLVSSVADIYNLKEKDVLTLDLFAQKKAVKLMAAIEHSKQQPLARLLTALGIENIGTKAAVTLAEHFGSLERLAQASVDELTGIDDIGPRTAQAVVDFFHNKHAKSLMEQLVQSGLRTTQDLAKRGQALLGKTFVFTGELEGLSREEAGRLVEARGGKVVGSVSPKTSFVVVGTNPGSKYQKALQLHIPVINQHQFKELLND